MILHPLGGDAATRLAKQSQFFSRAFGDNDSDVEFIHGTVEVPKCAYESYNRRKPRIPVTGMRLGPTDFHLRLPPIVNMIS